VVVVNKGGHVADLPLNLLSSELSERLAQAEEFSRDPGLAAAFSNVVSDPRFWAEAARDPVTFLAEQGVEVPTGLTIQFLDDPFGGRPTPDYEFFSVRLTHCRTVWVKKSDGCGWERVEVCLGFEIVPHPLPGGPIASSE
jgi:hypothetical protein